MGVEFVGSVGGELNLVGVSRRAGSVEGGLMVEGLKGKDEDEGGKRLS